MTSSDSVNLLYSTYPGKASRYLGRRDNPLAGKFPDSKIVTTKHVAPPHLSQLSNGPGETQTSYRYNDVAGLGSFVYVVGIGLLLPGSLKAGGDLRRGHLTTIDNLKPTEYALINKNYHDVYSVDDVRGSLIAALTVGSTIGIARRAKLVSIKVPDGINSVFTTSELVEGIMWAINDIVGQERQRKAVITISLGKYICGL